MEGFGVADVQRAEQEALAAEERSRAQVAAQVGEAWREAKQTMAKINRGSLKERHHVYAVGDRIPVFGNVVGPYSNRALTREYYSLPFCQPPGGVERIRQDLGEHLAGDRLVNTPYVLEFGRDTATTVTCNKRLGEKDMEQFRKAIAEEYYFQLFLDDLPVWGFVGKRERPSDEDGDSGERQVLFTHLHFDVHYNGDNVIEVNVSVDPSKSVDITDLLGADINFFFSAKWRPTTVPFERRLEKYSRYSFLPENLEVHWFSVINSCVTVLLLTTFLAAILMRVLRKDLAAKLGGDKDMEDGYDDFDQGWKCLRGDVFRLPASRPWLCALLGAGTQLLLMAAVVFLLALLGHFYPYNRGELMVALVLLYSFTSWFAGYTSGRWYSRLGGGGGGPHGPADDWPMTVIATAGVLNAPIVGTFMYLNTIHLIFRSTKALTFLTLCKMILLWGVVTLPSVVVGIIKGKNSGAHLDAPSRTNRVARRVPAKPWYLAPPFQVLMAGALPFSAIYIELYYVYVSVWGHKMYTIYSILAVVFAILLVVTSFISGERRPPGARRRPRRAGPVPVPARPRPPPRPPPAVALTYFQLAAEDHRWWWQAFFNGGSTGLFVLGYSFYFWSQSQMHGWLQWSDFMGHTFLASLAAFISLGTVGFLSSLAFVRYIYQAIKSD